MKKLALLLTCLLFFNSCKKNLSPIDEFIDPRDGHKYEIVQIGNQTWMAENLAYLPSVNRLRYYSNDYPMYYVYGYDGTSLDEAVVTDFYSTHGVLYNWPAAKKACPDGWYLPSDDDWKMLEMNLGMSAADVDSTDWRESGLVGDKLKSSSGWFEDNNGANSSLFNAMPSGFRLGYTFDCYFTKVEKNAIYWSGLEYSHGSAWCRLLSYDNEGINRKYLLKPYGLSVRCIKDN